MLAVNRCQTRDSIFIIAKRCIALTRFNIRYAIGPCDYIQPPRPFPVRAGRGWGARAISAPSRENQDKLIKLKTSVAPPLIKQHIHTHIQPHSKCTLAYIKTIPHPKPRSPPSLRSPEQHHFNFLSHAAAAASQTRTTQLNACTSPRCSHHFPPTPPPETPSPAPIRPNETDTTASASGGTPNAATTRRCIICTVLHAQHTRWHNNCTVRRCCRPSCCTCTYVGVSGCVCVCVA